MKSISFLFEYAAMKQLLNHGVAEEVIEKMKKDVQEFFMLPLEEKNAYTQLPNSIEGYHTELLILSIF